MFDISKLKAEAVLKSSQARLLLSKHSPDILLAVGVVGVITSVVLACKATLKANEKFHEIEESIREIKSKEELIQAEGKYTEEEVHMMEGAVYVNGGLEIASYYVPAAIVMALGLGSFIQSRNLLNGRYAAILAAYKVTQKTYEDYRRRVLEGGGEEFDLQVRSKDPSDRDEYILSKRNEEGELIPALTPSEKSNLRLGVSQYAKFFDESSPQWRQNMDANLFFLRAQQTNMNVQLAVRGHVFLNEVYDSLGIPRTQAGAVVGWVKGMGDDVVDFGLFNSFNQDAVNGYNSSQILLDFNVDGVIYDLI